jgi:hypothetical protein
MRRVMRWETVMEWTVAAIGLLVLVGGIALWAINRLAIRRLIESED